MQIVIMRRYHQLRRSSRFTAAGTQTPLPLSAHGYITLQRWITKRTNIPRGFINSELHPISPVTVIATARSVVWPPRSAAPGLYSLPSQCVQYQHNLMFC